MNLNDNETKVIEYYNDHSLEKFDMSLMTLSLKISIMALLNTYNSLNRRGLLITAYDNNDVGHMIVGLDEPITDIRQYLKKNKKQINHIADLLHIRINSLIWYYCKAAGILDKEEYWKISDEFMH